MGPEVTEKGGPHDRARIVRRYLSALDAQKPGRTAARTVESVLHRIHQIDTLLLSADPVQRLHLTQERIDLHAEQLRLQTSNSGEFEDLQKAFIRVARAYGDRHDITYSAWRQVGVDAEVLNKAGIHPAAKPARAAQAAPAKAETPAAPEKAAATAEAPAPDGKPEAPQAEAPKAEAPQTEAKKAPAKKAPDAPKKAATAKKTAAATNGSARKPSAKKAADPKPEQQQLPAEAHLLS